MYHCLYCRITLRKESEKIYEEHEFGFRHKTNKILFDLLGSYCGKTTEQVTLDATRDLWLSADEALKYGIIDEVVKTKKKGN